MAKFLPALFLALSGSMLAAAIPQYGPPSAPAPPPPSASLPSYESGPAAAPASYGGSQSAPAPPPPPPPPPSASIPSYAAAPAAAPAQSSSASASYGGAQGPSSSASSSYGGSSSGSSGSSSGGSGGALTVQCKASPDGSGKLKYDCSGVNKDAVTLKTEHFLWLENQGGSSQNLDIEIPNYKIDEFIRAAFKALGPQEGAKINILLKKPDITYNAAKDDAPKQQVGQPTVSLNYQPVDKVSVHYPTQKQYTSGGFSAPPPGAGAPAGSASGGSNFAAGSAGPAQGGNYGASQAGPVQGGNYGASQAGPVQGGNYGASQAGLVQGGNYGASQGGHSAGPAAGAYSRPQRQSGFNYYRVRQ